MSDDGHRRWTRRPLTEDERLLWEHAARTMTPLQETHHGRRAKPRVHPAAHVTDPVSDPDTQSSARATNPAPTPKTPAPPQRTPLQPRSQTHPPAPVRPVAMPAYRPPVSTPRTPVPDIAGFDAKSARRLRGGRVEIDARIDLHGMRQDEARAALVGFLQSSRSRGHRFVLVITGKGAPRRSAFDPDETEPWSFDRPNRPGVLRQRVPEWLSSPEFRALVVSFTEAAPHHGGNGALYVQIRSRA